MKTKIIVSVFFILTFFKTNAQCAMCRAVLENEVDQSAAKGINDGIIYLMSIPYILVGLVIFFIYKKYSKKST